VLRFSILGFDYATRLRDGCNGCRGSTCVIFRPFSFLQPSSWPTARLQPSSQPRFSPRVSGSRRSRFGEAAKRVSPESRDHLPSLDWKAICGMRDVLIHDYIGVDLDEVWNVASSRITPSLFHLAFALLLATSVTVFWTPLRTIAALSWSDDRYSHLLLIPMISAFLLYFERPRIFSQPTDRHGAAFLLLLGAVTVYALSALRCSTSDVYGGGSPRSPRYDANRIHGNDPATSCFHIPARPTPGCLKSVGPMPRVWLPSSRSSCSFLYRHAL